MQFLVLFGTGLALFFLLQFMSIMMIIKLAVLVVVMFVLVKAIQILISLF